MNKKDFKLLFSLILWNLIPSIYMLIKMNIIEINNVDINILGQLEWFDLIDEILVTTLIVPLYSLLKIDKASKEKNGFAFIFSFGIYFIFTMFISIYISQITSFMNAENASEFLRLQMISMLVVFISNFSVILLTLKEDFKTIGVLTLFKLFILTISDIVFINNFKELGSAYSEIFTNSLVSIISMIIILKNEYISFKKTDICWLRDYMKIGSFVGIQIFLDNFIYATMICKMVNAVSESGNYWVANNFIWGWLLIPVSCMSEIIRKNNYDKLNLDNVWKPALFIILLWIISLPGWKWFLDGPMAIDPSIILKILYPLVPFYLTYIVSNFIDAWFISKGKTIYNAINSFFVNIVYYGIAYILFTKGLFELNITFIILLFGFGMVVHMILSIIFYVVEQNIKSIVG